MYNGQFPGPLLRFKEGQSVTVDIFNDTDTPEQLHWHGQMIPVDVDGAAEEGTPYIPALQGGAEAYGITGVRAAALRAALDHKDIAAVAVQALIGRADDCWGGQQCPQFHASTDGPVQLSLSALVLSSTAMAQSHAYITQMRSSTTSHVFVQQSVDGEYGRYSVLGSVKDEQGNKTVTYLAKDGKSIAGEQR